MRTALISDIHGNFSGLMAVLDDITSSHCDRIICLGDLVEGGAQSIEVVRTIRDLGVLTVRGNHDENNVLDLPRDVTKYLASLPEEVVEGPVIYTHSSPSQRRLKIKNEIEAWNVFEDKAFRRVFVGDVHIPLIFGERSESPVMAAAYPISYNQAFQFSEDDRYIVCAGAVGYSRDGIRRLRYAIYDSKFDTVTFKSPDGPLLEF